MIERLARDGVVYAAAAIFSRGVTFLGLPIYTRLLDPASYGALELILTVGLLANLVVALEVVQGFARESAEQATPAQRAALAGTALCFTAAMHAGFLALVFPLAVPLASWLLGSPTLAVELRAGLVFIAVNAVFLQLQAQLRWELRVRGYAALSIFYGVSSLVLAAGLALMAGLQGLLWGQAFAAALSCGLGAVLLRKQLHITLALADLARMLRYSLPLVPSGISAFASFYLNRFLLSALSSLAEVGLFGVAQRIAAVTLLLIVGFQGALTPLIYRHHREPGVPSQLARIFEAFTGAGMLLCFALSAFSSQWVTWLAAAEFRPAAALLPWLAPAALLSQMYVFAPGIAIARKTSMQLLITLLAAGVAVGANLWLIPRHGVLGAAIANFAAAVFFFGAWLAASQRDYPLPLRWRALALATLFYGVCATLAPVIDRSQSPPVLSLALKVALVGVLAFALHWLGLLSWRAALRTPASRHTTQPV